MRTEDRWLEDTAANWAARGPDLPMDALRGMGEIGVHSRLDGVPGTHALLYRTGVVRLAWVLLAHATLWGTGTSLAWAEVLFREGRYDSADVESLRVCAMMHAHLREHSSAVPGIAAAVAFCRTAPHPTGVRRFPPPISANRVVQHGSLILNRAHLPDRRLVDGELLPVLVTPAGPERHIGVLPWAWWSPDLLARWRAPQQR